MSPGAAGTEVKRGPVRTSRSPRGCPHTRSLPKVAGRLGWCCGPSASMPGSPRCLHGGCTHGSWTGRPRVLLCWPRPQKTQQTSLRKSHSAGSPHLPRTRPGRGQMARVWAGLPGYPEPRAGGKALCGPALAPLLSVPAPPPPPQPARLGPVGWLEPLGATES